jgi:L-iditol 2-dehydrogenase
MARSVSDSTDAASSHRVVRLHAAGDIRVDVDARPSPGPGEVSLRVTSVGLCGSDLHWYSDGRIGETALDQPLVLGHEIAAVFDVGPRRGTRVAVDPADPCEVCATCRSGHEELCPVMRFAGHGTTDGALRQFMTWPERLVHPVPDSIGDAEASVLEALGVALHAVDLGAVAPGMRTAVVGCGPIGLLVIGALRAADVDDVVATDLLPHRVEAARAAGAGRAWIADDGVAASPSSDVPVGLVDVVFECAGDDSAVALAIELAAPAGRIVLVGIPGDDRTRFTASVARRKALTLVLCRRMKASDLDRAIALAGSGRIDLSRLISDRFGIDDAPAAFEALAARRGLKVVIEPQAAR